LLKIERNLGVPGVPGDRKVPCSCPRTARSP